MSDNCLDFSLSNLYFRQVMEQIDGQGRKVIAVCQALQNKEWEAFIIACEELIVWMTSQQRMMEKSGQNMAKHEMEELRQLQVIANVFPTEKY